ncbi:MAG TPA: methyl-accepting chemotaxis protein [bacterium]|nr:methyl-accepting chemotaxis protein [bacterium]
MRTKLILGFGVICASLIVLAAVGYGALASMQKIEREEVDRSDAAAMEAVQIRSNQNRIRGSMLEYIIGEDGAARDAIRLEIEDRSKDIALGLERVKSFVSSRDLPDTLALIGSLEKDLAAYRDGRDEEFRLIKVGREGEARVLGAGVQDQRFEQIRLKLMSIGEDLQKNADAAVVESGRLFTMTIRVFIAVAIAATLFSIFMVWLMNRLTAAPLREITAIAERVAAGDLTVSIESRKRSDEVGALQQAFLTMIEKLSGFASAAERIAGGDLTVTIEADGESDRVDMLRRALRVMITNLREMNRELREGFGVLASSSTEILATVSQVAASAAETATAVSETSTTAEEVKQTAHVSNQKAMAVQESAQKASAVSEKGNEAVNDTLEGMNRIREQMESIAETVVHLSEQGQAIGEIIAVVNDLAEQSNLLAVNAAIEATRAGEFGKGFGVVAQEVKSLAEQSRQATTQVRTILMEVQKATSAAVLATEQGTKAVALGVKQAGDAGESIRALMNSVIEASQAATQIAASSQQQLVGMDQIALAIANIKQATTQNMSGTRQLEASATNLQELGVRLKVLVERQRIAT